MYVASWDARTKLTSVAGMLSTQQVAKLPKSLKKNSLGCSECCCVIIFVFIFASTGNRIALLEKTIRCNELDDE